MSLALPFRRLALRPSRPCTSASICLVLGAVVGAHRDLGVLDRMGDVAAGGRGAGLRGCERRRTEQEGTGQGGVKVVHFHAVVSYVIRVAQGHVPGASTIMRSHARRASVGEHAIRS